MPVLTSLFCWVYFDVRRILLPLIIILIIALIVIIIVSIPRPKSSIEGSGIIEANEITISSKISGTIKEMRVKEGESISKGETLVVIDHRELDAKRKEALANILSAEAALEEIKIKKRDLQKNLNRFRNLHQDGDVSDKDIEGLETQFEILTNQENRTGLLIKQARAMLELLDIQKESANLMSPIDGIVFQKYYNQGELVYSGSPILKVGTLDTVWLKIYIPGKDLGRLRQGKKVEVVVDAYPGEIFPGEITWIASESEFTPKNVQIKDERANLVYAVKILIPNLENKLLSGMMADARIIEKGSR